MYATPCYDSGNYIISLLSKAATCILARAIIASFLAVDHAVHIGTAIYTRHCTVCECVDGCTLISVLINACVYIVYCPVYIISLQISQPLSLTSQETLVSLTCELHLAF